MPADQLHLRLKPEAFFYFLKVLSIISNIKYKIYNIKYNLAYRIFLPSFLTPLMSYKVCTLHISYIFDIMRLYVTIYFLFLTCWTILSVSEQVCLVECKEQKKCMT